MGVSAHSHSPIVKSKYNGVTTGMNDVFLLSQSCLNNTDKVTMAVKILIVDDMPDAIEFLPDWLQREGYETQMATRGQQALALAEECHPDLILLDVMMPGMDGIETCRRLRLNPSTSDIPVILISARSPSEGRAEGLLAGATDYIAKPIHFPYLLERIQSIVGQQDEHSLDHRRLLEEMAYTALTVLPCNLAWLLIVDSDKHWLVHQCVATDRGAEAASNFLAMLQDDQNEVRLPLRPGDNPLADAILNRKVLINIPTSRFQNLPGGTDFYRVFTYFRFAFISLMPLLTTERAVGMMVLATTDNGVVESRRTQQILSSLSTQAALVVDNARLIADLASREGQMRAEQSFRKMVLDTMGEGLIVVDDEAKITYVNNRLLRMTDYTREMLYGRSVGLLFHPAQRERIVSSLTGKPRKTLPFSQHLFTRHGEIVPVLLSRAVAPASDDGGQNTVMVVTDLAELQKHEDALRLQTQRLMVINRAANAISSARSFQEVIMISLESALQIVQGSSASILLRNMEQTDMLVVVASIGAEAADNEGKIVPIGEGLSGWVASTSKSQLVNASSDSANEMPITEYGPEARSVIVVPLIASDELIGVLEVINKSEGFFDEQDMKTLESLAGSTAVAIENARLFDQMRRRVTELSTLLDASAAVSSTLDFGDILERIARQLSLALQVERVVISTWHRQSNHLSILAEVVNVYWTPNSGPLLNLDQMPVTRAAFGRGILPATSEEAAEGNASGLHTCMVVPLYIDGQVVGTVSLHSESRKDAVAQSLLNSVSDVVLRWQEGVEAQDPRNWLSRPVLTDLAQRVLQASGFRWCSVTQWDAETSELRLLREIGHALWLDHAGLTWDVRHYSSMAEVLSSGQAITLQSDRLSHDLGERTYLNSVGGRTCLIAPLFVRGEPNGLVKLIDSKRDFRVFDNAELSLCQGIANVVGNAMENAQLYANQEARASALEAAYTELQEADRAKDDLLQNLSHELRTPLTHILGYLRLLTDGAFGSLSPEQNDAMVLVVNKAQHLADLVKDIIAVQESESHNLEPKPIHLERVVALAVRSIAGQTQGRDIRIVPHIPANLSPIYADPVRVGEVFEELLENAIKFSPNSTEIEVTIEDPGGPMLHASVQDHGIGIAPDEHEKIFRRFYQVDSGTTRRFGGTGLGLAIVRRVIEGHNGRVWVESKLGEGCTFHLTLPKVTAIDI